MKYSRHRDRLTPDMFLDAVLPEDTRERLFILGHADLQDGWEPGLPDDRTGGHGFPAGSEPGGKPDRVEEPGGNMDAVLGSVAGDGLAGQSLSLFPPMPGDIAQWRETLGTRPELKPCLQRLADGLAFGMDRSAAAGNPFMRAEAHLQVSGVDPDADGKPWVSATVTHVWDFAADGGATTTVEAEFGMEEKDNKKAAAKPKKKSKAGQEGEYVSVLDR